jgi:DNA (cytosine-5)-methyltransferase 1
VNDTKPTFAEMFAGIGGFRLGLERAGWKCAWANEIDKHACKVYRKNFGEKELFEGDICKVDPKDIPDIDILVGGFPCQAFSMAGKRQGFKDIRGTMFFQVARIAEAKRPKILLLENVKGLLSHDNGDTFETILRTLGDLGYWYEYQVLNSKYFGVPQNRERVFIIGHLRDSGSKQIFPIGESAELSYEEDRREQEDGSGICSTIDARYGALRNSGETYILSYSPRTNSSKLGGSGPLLSNEHCFTLDSTPHMILLDNFGGNIKQRVKEADSAWTLGGSKTGVMQQQQIRRLTPIECKRLQGFPDRWTEGISDTQRYKCLGNAVTVNVIEFLGRQLLIGNNRS